MRATNWLWRSTAIFAAVSTLLLAGGGVYAMRDMLYPPANGDTAAPPKVQLPTSNLLAQDKIQIAAVGDSLTKGTGDESGNGYVGDVRNGLAKESAKPVYVIGNFAVNGYRSDQLLRDLKTRQGVVDTLGQANLILFTIGGNDLFGFAQDQFAEIHDIDAEEIDKRLPEIASRIGGIFAQLHAINPKATIVYVEMYNPFLDMDETGKTSVTIQKLNEQAFEMASRYPNIVVVPTFDLFVVNHNRYLFSDHFHPNQDGYERMAERIVQVLK